MPEPEPDGSAVSPVVIVELAPLPVAPSSPGSGAGPGDGGGAADAEAAATDRARDRRAGAEDGGARRGDAAGARAEGGRKEARGEFGHAEVGDPAGAAGRARAAHHGRAALRAEHRGGAGGADPGSAASRAAIASWRDLLLARLQQNKRYPASAEARREQGIVTLSFPVDRKAVSWPASITRSSGVAALDDEVMTMVKRAQPLPAFPPAMTQKSRST